MKESQETSLWLFYLFIFSAYHPGCSVSSGLGLVFVQTVVYKERHF